LIDACPMKESTNQCHHIQWSQDRLSQIRKFLFKTISTAN
jgi:hypothetical protein